MDIRRRRVSHARSRGAARPLVVGIVAIFAVLLLAAWFLIIRPHRQLMAQDDSGRAPVTAPDTDTATTPAPGNVEAMDVNQLLAEARRAMTEQRVVAPAKNNAFEYYLRALSKQPGNSVATDALRETFPFAANTAEQTINQRDFAEAQRQIDLLARADPANYTLTILRSKLDAQRKTLDKEQQQALDQQRAAQLATQKAATDKVEADRLAEQQRVQAAEQERAQARAAQSRSTTAPAQAPEAAATQPVAGAAPTPSTAGGGDSQPVLLHRVDPRYPMQAKRASQEGWVDVSYAIGADGSVSDVKIVNAQPRHVFERETLDAVSRWKFKPAMRDGAPVASSGSQHIIFKLHN